MYMKYYSMYINIIVYIYKILCLYIKLLMNYFILFSLFVEYNSGAYLTLTEHLTWS